MSTLPAHEPRCGDAADGHSISLVVEGRARDVGTITVARVLPSPRRRMVGPFIFVDHMGPVTLAPGVGFDIRPHPHVGLSTVSYLFAGENTHRDSLGNVRTNVPGDVNVMTAGRGIVHSERADAGFRERGGAMHGLQLWLALTGDHEDDEPSFEHHPERTLPAIAPGANARGRVLIGEAFGARSPIRHPSEPLLVDLQLDAGASIEIEPAAIERGILVVAGELCIGADTLGVDHLAVLAVDRTVRATATVATRAVLLGGPAMPPRFIEWNFVASSRARIERARDAWLAREFPAIPGDDIEFIPYPDAQR